VSDLRLNGRKFDSLPPREWAHKPPVFHQASQANSASYPHWDGKLVPAKVKWCSVAREWREAYSTSVERLPERLRYDRLITCGVQIRFTLLVWLWVFVI